MFLYSGVDFDSGAFSNCLKLNKASLKLSKTYSVSPFQKVALAVNLASLGVAIDFLNIFIAS